MSSNQDLLDTDAETMGPARVITPFALGGNGTYMQPHAGRVHFKVTTVPVQFKNSKTNKPSVLKAMACLTE
jgi:hypothetical protein